MDQHTNNQQGPEKDKLYRESFYPTHIYFFDHPTAQETNKRIKKNVDLWREHQSASPVFVNGAG